MLAKLAPNEDGRPAFNRVTTRRARRGSLAITFHLRLPPLEKCFYFARRQMRHPTARVDPAAPAYAAGAAARRRARAFHARAHGSFTRFRGPRHKFCVYPSRRPADGLETQDPPAVKLDFASGRARPAIQSLIV